MTATIRLEPRDRYRNTICDRFVYIELLELPQPVNAVVSYDQLVANLRSTLRACAS